MSPVHSVTILSNSVNGGSLRRTPSTQSMDSGREWTVIACSRIGGNSQKQLTVNAIFFTYSTKLLHFFKLYFEDIRMALITF